jgi:hypothetical protein
LDPQLQNKNKCIPQEHTFSVYIHECSTLGTPYGIKLRCYWECLREQLGNLGTSKKHDENMLGTYYQQRRETKQNKNCPHLTPKRKNKAHHGCMLSLRIDCMKFLFTKLFITILGPNTRERERERAKGQS